VAIKVTLEAGHSLKLMVSYILLVFCHMARSQLVLVLLALTLELAATILIGSRIT
jgi:hypothetical protein